MLPFVPRKVALRARPSLSVPDAPVPGPSASSTQPPHAPTPEQVSPPSTNANKGKGKGKSTDGPTDEHLAILLTLSLSDHALWTNVDLRRAVSLADDGWIPLSILLQHSTYLLHLHPQLPDSALVRAIRGHAEDVLEVRVRVTAPSKNAWSGKDSSLSRDDEGGYEVRLKHCPDALARVRNSARNEWEGRTVYVENVPLAHRTVPLVYRFVSSLLPIPTPCSPPSSTGTPQPNRIQTITLPPHHLDRPGTPPKCKGFALVTFASAADATRLAADWPWLPRRASVFHEGEAEKDKKDAEEDAVKFGFRALPKARWDAQKEEYLEHRQRLLDEIARADAEHPHARPHSRRDAAPPPGPHPEYEERAEPASAPTRKRGPTVPPSPTLGLSAPYPPSCLVFVRNVHPETNKTTLKVLLAAHAPPGTAAALDYVDYSKGMASCHVRASTPAHARALVAAFADRLRVQTHGLDGAGSTSPPSPSPSAANSVPDANASSRPITAELVDGEREALYWNKVPEKVRREAVRKAVAQSQASASAGGDAAVDVEMAEGEEQGGGRLGGEEARREGKRPRKRRRKA
ncbi:hypothetical protein LXA43DRAFT_1182085 [Ganoderma leucocontextum]|nr:hypothetical protein LXA43DRAFT_1182085 [Ganoderma leucocontextum]